MEKIGKVCFVCEKQLQPDSYTYHPKVNLPICDHCKGTESEKIKVDDLLEGLAERFVCGCI